MEETSTKELIKAIVENKYLTDAEKAAAIKEITSIKTEENNAEEEILLEEK